MTRGEGVMLNRAAEPGACAKTRLKKLAVRLRQHVYSLRLACAKAFRLWAAATG